ncbi:DUF3139 domain-containing protein [Staphylococcus pseudintermedius]
MIGIILSLIVIFIVVAGAFFAFKGYQKSQNLKMIDQYLTENHLKDKVIEEKDEYDPRKGIFYKELTIKGDEKIHTSHSRSI